MNVVHKQINELIPYAKNPRTHSDSQVAQIAASIREFGFMNPILIDAENNIIAGHGRVLAARKLGLEEVPCVLHDHLTATQRKAYILADNKIALNAGWDEDMLRLELVDLDGMGVDISVTGFDSPDLGEEFIDHEGEDHSGASPWERMSGEAGDGIMFSFGAITARLSEETYSLFETYVPESDIGPWIERMITNALCNS